MSHPKRYSQIDRRLFKKIGKRIRYLRREEHHLSQAGFARRIGCSRETISQIERGCRPPSPEHYVLFSLVFNDGEAQSIMKFYKQRADPA